MGNSSWSRGETFATSFLPASEVMVPTDFIWNHERRVNKVSVGLRQRGSQLV